MHPVSNLKPNQKGQGTVDYLMLTALIAGVLVPIILKNFGEPMLRTMTNEKDRLVGFVAQNKKQKVPNAWFSRSDPAKVPEPSVAAPKDIPPPDPLAPPGEVPPPQGPKEPKNIPPPRPGNPPRVNAPGQAPPPSVPPPGEGGGGGGSGASGGGSSFGGGPSDGSDFFGGGGGSKTGGSEGGGKDGGSKGTFSNKGGAEGGEGSSGGGQGGGGGKRGGGTSGGGESEGKKEGGVQGSKSKMDQLAEAEDRERAKKGQFDWWLFFKILIALAIAALLVLIALGNMRRR
jgi:hypothetical protein